MFGFKIFTCSFANKRNVTLESLNTSFLAIEILDRNLGMKESGMIFEGYY